MNPDVVLMDIGLPDISGIEAAKRILNNNLDQKIMMLTSHIDEKGGYGLFKRRGLCLCTKRYKY